MRRKNYRGRRMAKSSRALIFKGMLIVILSVLMAIGWKGRQEFIKNHFAKNTIIHGVDCSYLSVEKATDRIISTLTEQKITLVFTDTQHELCGKDFGISISNTEELSAILESQRQHRQDSDRTYTLENSITVSSEVTRKCLNSLKELKPKNMIKPKDAYIKVQDDGTLAIEKEVTGSQINYEKALSYCTERILQGDTTIDFTSLAIKPKILSNDSKLRQQVNSVNKILETVIDFQMADGSFYTLNKEITKTWVATDRDGNYYVDLENVSSFVQELNNHANQAIGIGTFIPTNMTTPIDLPSKIKVEVDVEKEVERITSELMAGGEYKRSPIYKEGYSPEEMLSYIEVDITRQMVWVYINGECVFSTPCVTGKPPRHDTPTGVFYLAYKTRDAVLRGYNDDGSKYESKVSYWMPFNGGVGFHDANWQRQFGGDWYLTHGSHGCVNLPLEAARTMYNYINSSIPIIVYCS